MDNFPFTTVGGLGTYNNLGDDTVIDGGTNVINDTIDGSTVFNGHTLSDYANGDVAGISGDTKFALWVGVSGGSNNQDAIENVVVTTGGRPASALTATMGLGMLAVLGRCRHAPQKAPHCLSIF